MFASPDQPRFDHDVLTGESKGLLIEESRTNLLEYSEDFSSWQYNSNVVAKDNYIVAPDGTVGASEIVETTTNTQHNVAQSISTTGQKVFSVFVKKGVGSRNFRITDYNATDGEVSVTYNLSTGDKVSEAGSPGSTITYYSNGWYRISITSTTTTSSIYYIQLMDNNTTTYTGDGYSSIYIWGAQLEVGSFPTSYIKTSGASATRSADNASITGENFSSWYRQDEGSMVCEGSIDMNKTKGGTGMPLYNVLRDTTSLLGLSRDSSSWYHGIINNTISNFEYWNNVKSVTGAITYNYNDGYIHSYINGNQNLSSTTWLREKDIVHEQAETLKLGTGAHVSNVLNGHIKRFTYYPQQLTNEQLQNLTR
jgi:hypothetical protein